MESHLGAMAGMKKNIFPYGVYILRGRRDLRYTLGKLALKKEHGIYTSAIFSSKWIGSDNAARFFRMFFFCNKWRNELYILCN